MSLLRFTSSKVLGVTSRATLKVSQCAIALLRMLPLTDFLFTACWKEKFLNWRNRRLATLLYRNLTSSSFPEMQDLVIIGGGPGGYVAAIKAGQLGMKASRTDKT